ncbi:hypothetical protein UFOVP1229_137 [uncultured Caudovirales phage]|uniref:Uncharacterized protein n=1 Tax=uncultured Caudovirales phage TaxID=2100421 RepID=A0A6J5R7K4_9CAUD|nr:hypothetical protein UFOVP1229_137 [uncultured Caudovirales phage]
MTTFRTVREHWTEVKTVVEVDGQPTVVQTCCACKGAGLTRRQCADVSGNKTPCRCLCHKHAKRESVK